MRDKTSRGVTTPGWATILPGAPSGTPEPPAPPVPPAPPAPPARFGTPPQFGAAFGGAPGMASSVGIAPNPGYGPPPAAFSPGIPNPAFPAMALPFAPPPKRTNPALVIAAVVGGVVLVLVLIAIAIPVFLAQQKPKPVTLTIPASFDGSPRITSNEAQQATGLIVQGLTAQSPTVAGSFDAAVYSAGTSPAVLVAAGKLTRRPTSNDRARFFDGFNNAQGDDDPVTLATVPPGPLGGTTECGLANSTGTPAVLCISMDDSAIVFVAVYTTDLTQGTMTALEMRSTVEHK
jgi:hypothetical protein